MLKWPPDFCATYLFSSTKYVFGDVFRDKEYDLYYLQSRYYAPEIGRFLNLDIFIATGQELLGNNMFVYCENNAANRLDPTGQYMVGVDFLNRAGGFSGLSSSTTGGGANSTSQDMSKNGISQGKQTPSFSPGKRDAKELVQVVKRDVRSVVTAINSLPDKHPEIKIYQGGNDISSGVNNIKTGVAFLYSPVPTVIDDVVGVGYCAYGVMQAAGGLVKVLLGFESL